MLNYHPILLCSNILNLSSLTSLSLVVILLLPIINHGCHLKYLTLSIGSSTCTFICLSLILRLLILLWYYHLWLIDRNKLSLRNGLLMLLLLWDLLRMRVSSSDILRKCNMRCRYFNLFSITSSLDILVLLLNNLTLGVQELFLRLWLHLRTPY